MQASTSGQVAGCTTAVKHRQHASASCLYFRPCPRLENGNNTQYHQRCIVTQAKRGNDDDKQSFNPKDVEELKDLMPDPQESLFDDSTLCMDC